MSLCLVIYSYPCPLLNFEHLICNNNKQCLYPWEHWRPFHSCLYNRIKGHTSGFKSAIRFWDSWPILDEDLTLSEVNVMFNQMPISNVYALPYEDVVVTVAITEIWRRKGLMSHHRSQDPVVYSLSKKKHHKYEQEKLLKFNKFGDWKYESHRNTLHVIHMLSKFSLYAIVQCINVQCLMTLLFLWRPKICVEVCTCLEYLLNIFIIECSNLISRFPKQNQIN